MRINILENSSPFISKHVWAISRPSLDYKTIVGEEIKSLDLPINEFPSVVLKIESTILEREILTTARNHTMWAQTSRVQNILEFQYPIEFSDYKFFFEEQQELMVLASKNSRQDDYRSLLPIMSLTTYCIRISVRDLIKLMKTFRAYSKIIPHLRKRFAAVADSMSLVLSDLGYGGYQFKRYKPLDLLKGILSDENTLAGSFAVVTSAVPLGLRAHMVRHRALHIADNLAQLMLSESIITETLDMKMRIQVSGHVDDFKNIVGKRSCWIAQYNLWKDFLNKASEIMNVGQAELPCANGVCPFREDAATRLTVKDPNAPCPIYLRMEGIKPSILQVVQMHKQIVEDERQLFWLDEINKLEPTI